MIIPKLLILLSNPYIGIPFYIFSVITLSTCIYLIIQKFRRKQVSHKSLIEWSVFSGLPAIIITSFFISGVFFDEQITDILTFLYLPLVGVALATNFFGWLFAAIAVGYTALIVVVIIQPILFLASKLLNEKLQVGLFEKKISLGLISGTVLTLLLYIVVVIVSEAYLRIPSEFHIFNAHLKDVCSDEKHLTECPRSLEDLRNFDPPHFEKLNHKAVLRYYYDEIGKGTFIVRFGNQFLVSDIRLDDRWLYYVQPSVFPTNHPTYPPDMEGKWK